jgi:hypothetical protein
VGSFSGFLFLRDKIVNANEKDRSDYSAVKLDEVKSARDRHHWPNDQRDTRAWPATGS